MNIFRILTVVMTFAFYADAAVIYLGDNVVVPAEKPINAIIVDANGQTYEKVYHYNPAVSGVDIGNGWDAESTSVFFPDYNVRYLWNGGYWLNDAGYYWLGATAIITIIQDGAPTGMVTGQTIGTTAGTTTGPITMMMITGTTAITNIGTIGSFRPGLKTGFSSLSITH